jgi:ketosteroid isomerase-like protein
MSQENVQSFERALAAYNRRDVEALLAELDPDVEWDPALEVLLGGEATIYRGHEGVRKLLHGTDESLSEINVEFSETRDLGDRIVGFGHIRVRGRESGAMTESPVAIVSDLRDGKTYRVRTYLERDKTLEAAGLSE